MATIEAAVGLRARAGSREALLRAAFDGLATTPGLDVSRRSLLWDCTDPELERCAAAALSTDLDLEALRTEVRRQQDRLARDLSADQAPLRMELLWAHDPEGTATPRPPGPPPPLAGVDLPPGIKVEDVRPPMPPGRTELHPEVRTRASACGPLAEVAPQARDPETTRLVSELLYLVPEPYIERPLPFMPRFETTRRRVEGGVVYDAAAEDPTDLLAAAAEAFARAQPCGDPVGPTTILPADVVDVVVAIPEGSTPEQRMRLWLEATSAVMVRAHLWLRRAVVLVDGVDELRGALLGRIGDVPPALGQLHHVALHMDPRMDLHHVELWVRRPP